MQQRAISGWFSMGFNYFQRVPVNKVELGNWKVINHH